MTPDQIEMLKEIESKVKKAMHDLGNALQVVMYLIRKGGKK